MSVEALSYVLGTNRWTLAEDRLVLLAYADSADRGTGYGFSRVEVLAEAACVHRTTVMNATKRLEAEGELLVHRPKVRARGRHNTYVVVMGRDPYEIAADRGWCRPVLSPEAQSRLASRTESRVEEPVADPADEEEPVADLADAPPSPSVTTTPHDPAVPPVGARTEQWSPRATDTPRNGRRSVGDRSALGRPSPAPAPNPTNPAPPAREAARVRSSTSPAAEPLRELERLVTQRGVVTRWDLPPEKAVLLRAVVELVGLERLATVAVDYAQRKGTPRSAVAWMGPWVELGQSSGVPATECRVVELPPACGQCDGHHGGPRRLVLEDGRPGDWCPRCSREALTQPAF